MKTPKKGDKFADLRDVTKEYVAHVVSSFKDNERTFLVLKCWVSFKSRWAYEVMSIEAFNYYVKEKMMNKKEA